MNMNIPDALVPYVERVRMPPFTVRAELYDLDDDEEAPPAAEPMWPLLPVFRLRPRVRIEQLSDPGIDSEVLRSFIFDPVYRGKAIQVGTSGLVLVVAATTDDRFNFDADPYFCFESLDGNRHALAYEQHGPTIFIDGPGEDFSAILQTYMPMSMAPVTSQPDHDANLRLATGNLIFSEANAPLKICLDFSRCSSLPDGPQYYSAKCVEEAFAHDRWKHTDACLELSNADQQFPWESLQHLQIGKLLLHNVSVPMSVLLETQASILELDAINGIDMGHSDGPLIRPTPLKLFIGVIQLHTPRQAEEFLEAFLPLSETLQIRYLEFGVGVWDAFWQSTTWTRNYTCRSVLFKFVHLQGLLAGDKVQLLIDQIPSHWSVLDWNISSSSLYGGMGGIRVELKRIPNQVSPKDMAFMRPDTNPFLVSKGPWKDERHTKILASIHGAIENDHAKMIEIAERYIPTLLKPQSDEARSKDHDISILEHEMLLMEVFPHVDFLHAKCQTMTINDAKLRSDYNTYKAHAHRELQKVIRDQARTEKELQVLNRNKARGDKKVHNLEIALKSQVRRLELLLQESGRQHGQLKNRMNRMEEERRRSDARIGQMKVERRQVEERHEEERRQLEARIGQLEEERRQSDARIDQLEEERRQAEERHEQERREVEERLGEERHRSDARIDQLERHMQAFLERNNL